MGEVPDPDKGNIKSLIKRECKDRQPKTANMFIIMWSELKLALGKSFRSIWQN